MFKITVFGTGSRGNSALVSDGETKILIDAGIRPEIVQRATMISDIAAVMLTHEHGDHSDYLKHYMSDYARNIYATVGTWDKIRTTWVSVNSIIQYGVACTVGTLTITPFPLSHDAAEPCGFFIRNELGETLVWGSDTGTMDGLEMDKPADCYVIEANYDENDIDERLEKGEMPYAGLHGRLTSEFGHLSIQQAAAWLKENAGPESHIIVLSPHPEIFNGNEQLFNCGYSYVAFPTGFPWPFAFGKICPFAD